MEIFYNKFTRTFSIKSVTLDYHDFKKSYLKLVKESDEQCRIISGSKIFSKVSGSNIEIIVSRDAEIQYYIYQQIKAGAPWIKLRVKPFTKAYKDLLQVASNAISMIDKLIPMIVDDSKLSNAEELTSYKSGAYKTYSHRIDNFNRLVFKPIYGYGQVRLLQVMFHYDDLVLKDDPNFEYKMALIDLYNELSEDDKSIEFKSLSERISSLMIK